MFTIVLFVYLQSNLDVMLVKTRATGQYPTRADCEAQARQQRCTLPIPQGYAAAWQDAMCVPVNRGVIVVADPAIELPNLPGADRALPGCDEKRPRRRRGHAR